MRLACLKNFENFDLRFSSNWVITTSVTGVRSKLLTPKLVKTEKYWTQTRQPEIPNKLENLTQFGIRLKFVESEDCN